MLSTHPLVPRLGPAGRRVDLGEIRGNKPAFGWLGRDEDRHLAPRPGHEHCEQMRVFDEPPCRRAFLKPDPHCGRNGVTTPTLRAPARWRAWSSVMTRSTSARTTPALSRRPSVCTMSTQSLDSVSVDRVATSTCPSYRRRTMKSTRCGSE